MTGIQWAALIALGLCVAYAYLTAFVPRLGDWIDGPE